MVKANYKNEQSCIPAFAIVAVLIVICAALCGCSFGNSAEKVYTFKDAGFEMQFPAKPEVAEGKGKFHKKGDVYLGTSSDSAVSVIVEDAPGNMAAFAESNPNKTDLEESLTANLYLAALDDVLVLHIEDVDPNQLKYLNFNAQSDYSGMVMYKGAEERGSSGSGNYVEAYYCTALVYDDGKIYSITTASDTYEQALEYAESFKLI